MYSRALPRRALRTKRADENQRQDQRLERADHIVKAARPLPQPEDAIDVLGAEKRQRERHDKPQKRTHESHGNGFAKGREHLKPFCPCFPQMRREHEGQDPAQTLQANPDTFGREVKVVQAPCKQGKEPNPERGLLLRKVKQTRQRNGGSFDG